MASYYTLTHNAGSQLLYIRNSFICGHTAIFIAGYARIGERVQQDMVNSIVLVHTFHQKKVE